MDWPQTDPSDEDHVPTTSRKRSSRACDQCRKTKSKCERSNADDGKCKSCELAGTDCTFLGPSFKRGPPKGYIHAIEQRWHQVEALLGAILQCPDERVRHLVADLKQDDLAREILGRVDSGPYGPSGRRNQPADATKEDFFASILKSSEASTIADASRAKRQSRVTREIVSSNRDHGLSVVPTKEWQDNLSTRLALGPRTSARAPDPNGEPVAQKRRLNDKDKEHTNGWDGLYKIEPTDKADDFQTATEGMGLLSLDENQEVRFHGQASGLHLLGRNERIDGRIEGGIWRLPMARVWPPSKFGIERYQQGDTPVQLPPKATQDKLIALYFTYIHPVFPVIHKARFLSEYKSRNIESDFKQSPKFSDSSTHSSSPRPEPTQEATPLLLLSIFTIVTRFTEIPKPTDGRMWEAGCEYLDAARSILSSVFHVARPSTVQSLLLLGNREFGIGSMEQGWIFIGMAIRMAFDLGLNCNSANWKIYGHVMFSPEETQTRNQIWWGCVLADRYGSEYMGRPTMIKDEDFETPLPEVDRVEDSQLWQPRFTKETSPYAPVPSHTMNIFVEASKLAMILGAIVNEIYPIRPQPGKSRQATLSAIESRLDQWYIALPDELRYDVSAAKYTPSPQIISLHVRYWAAVLLLHRAFIPNLKGQEEAPHMSTGEARALDLAHSAACHISSLTESYRQTFTMERASPFITSYLLSASIMHLVTLTIRSDNVAARVGLEQCVAGLKDMRVIWPSAARAHDLLTGVQMQTRPLPRVSRQYRDRKRPAHDAFGDEKSPEFLQRETYGGASDSDNVQETGGIDTGGVQDLGTRMMAHMLGLEFPGIETSTSYYPGYEWWPRMNGSSPSLTQNLGYPSEEAIVQLEPSQWPRAETGSAPTTVPGYGQNSVHFGYDFGHF